MTTTFPTAVPYQHEGKDIYLINSQGIIFAEDGTLDEANLARTIARGRYTTEVPPQRLFIDDEYENRDKLIREQQSFNTDANTWSQRFYVRVGAELYRAGVFFRSRQEGWLDIIFADQEVLPYHAVPTTPQGHRQVQASTGNMLDNSATLLEALTASVQREPARIMQTIEINRDQYGGAEEHGDEAPTHRVEHIIRREQFGEGDPVPIDSESQEAVSMMRDLAVKKFNDDDLYHGNGYLHDIILALACQAVRVADPALDSPSGVGFLVSTLDGQITNHLPDTLPARKAGDDLPSRVETNFVLMHQAVMTTLVAEAIQVPMQDGTLRDYHLPVGADSVASLTRSAHAEYNRLLLDATGDSKEGCGLMDALPDLDYSEETQDE